jgi:hypothetical protein
MIGVSEVIESLLKSMPECLTAHLKGILIIMHKNPKLVCNGVNSGKILAVLCRMPKDVINQIKKEKLFDAIGTNEIKFSNKLDDNEFKCITSDVFAIDCSVVGRCVNGYKFYNYKIVKNTF